MPDPAKVKSSAVPEADTVLPWPVQLSYVQDKDFFSSQYYEWVSEKLAT